MAEENLVRIVDHLHGLESASLLQRLAESVAYVGANQLEEYGALEEMVEQERGHLRRLADLLDALDATPGPRRVQVASGNLHYNRPHVLLPQLVADKEQLIAQYEAANERVAGHPRAADVVAGILADHRAHLEKLRGLLAGAKA